MEVARVATAPWNTMVAAVLAATLEMAGRPGLLHLAVLAGVPRDITQARMVSVLAGVLG